MPVYQFETMPTASTPCDRHDAGMDREGVEPLPDKRKSSSKDTVVSRHVAKEAPCKQRLS
jgi:hypothetical protein